MRKDNQCLWGVLVMNSSNEIRCGMYNTILRWSKKSLSEDVIITRCVISLPV